VEAEEMTKADELKTKRERIIHNEQVKLTASFIVNFGLIMGIAVIIGTVYSLADKLPRFIAYPYIFLGLIGSVYCFHWSNKYLNKLVDPDDTPKPTKRRTKRKK
jgi:hypothetical protein